jgi:AcrR family transcriptional regulator
VYVKDGGVDVAGMEQTEPRRQARGARRIASALDAAAEVFAEVGFQAATTNAIAARAGMSPGSLYQFFANKDAIGDALAARYIAELKLAQEQAFLGEAEHIDLDALIDRVVDPLVAFNVKNPGFEALLADPSRPGLIGRAEHPLHAAVLAQVEQLLHLRMPDVDRPRRRLMARVVVQVFKGLLPLAMGVSERERRSVVAELKRVILRYLQPLDAPPSATG